MNLRKKYFGESAELELIRRLEKYDNPVPVRLLADQVGISYDSAINWLQGFVEDGYLVLKETEGQIVAEVTKKGREPAR